MVTCVDFENNWMIFSGDVVEMKELKLLLSLVCDLSRL